MSTLSKTQTFKLHKKGSQSYTSVEAEQQGDGTQWMALCPFHSDTNPSLSINEDTEQWQCFGCHATGSLWDDNFKSPHKLDATERIKLLKQRIKNNKEHEAAIKGGQILATYDYCDAEGKVIYQTVKLQAPPPKNKTFYQRRPDGDGGWINNLNGVTPLLYRLPELLAGENLVFICEGEKDVETLRALGCTATCNPMGAGKWRSEYNSCLTGKEVIILPDNDTPGQEHAKKVATSLYGVAKELYIINLPNLSEKGDVTDFLQTRTLDDLVQVIADTPKFKPKTLEGLVLPTLGDIGRMNLKIEWAVGNEERPLLPKQAVTIFSGRWGLGKTQFWLELGTAAESGSDWNGLPTIKMPVYIADYENPTPWLSEIGRRPHLQNSEIQVFHQGVGTKPYYFDGDDWEKFIDLEPGLLIIDGLRSSAPKLDENSSSDMTLLLDKYKKLRDAGFTIVCLHHPPKSNDLDVRGSGAIMGNSDCGLILRLNKDSKKKAKEDDEDEEMSPPYTIVVGPTQKSRFIKSTHYFWFNPPQPITLSEDPGLGRIKEMAELLKKMFDSSGEKVTQKAWKARCENELGIKHNAFYRLEKKGLALREWKGFAEEGRSKTYIPLGKIDP
jgi:hypothetical protein